MDDVDQLFQLESSYSRILPLNSEYDQVSEIVKKSFKSDNFCISAIFKIDNPELEKQFEKQKEEIALKRGKEPSVEDVFHGTTIKSAQKIMAGGFDPSYNTTSAYGRGTYASPSIKEALMYCKDAREKGSTSMVFLCKCLKGTFAKTGRNQQIKGDYSGCGTIFVTPYRYGIIPTYLICYITPGTNNGLKRKRKSISFSSLFVLWLVPVSSDGRPWVLLENIFQSKDL